MIPEISCAVAPSSHNHVHLSPWHPRPCEGQNYSHAPPKPTEDSWTESWSILAALMKLSGTSRQLPMGFTFIFTAR